MRKLLTTAILTLVFCGLGYAQNFDVAFKYHYPERMYILDSMSTYGIKRGSMDSVSYYSMVQRLRTKATEHKDKKAYLYADYLIFYFNLYSFKWDDEKVNKECSELLERAETLNVVTIKINIYLNMGYYNYMKKNPDYIQYFDYLNRAYLLYKDMDAKSCTDKAYNLYSLALAYYKFGDYASAVKYASTVNEIPTINYINMFNDNLLGVSYMELGNMDSSRYYLNKTYRMAVEFENEGTFLGWTGIALGNIGHTWYRQKQYDKAAEYYLKGLKICSDNGLWDNASPFASHLIYIYVDQHKMKEASDLFPLARKATYLYNNNEGYYFYYDALADYYKAQNDSKNALMYRDSSIFWNDSLQKTFDRNLKVRAELINYQQLAADKQAELQLEKQREELIKNATFAAALVLLIVALFIYTRQTRVIKVRTLLLHEIHHRVKNNLQIISSILDIQQRSLNNPELKGAFNDAKSRINSMALVHQNLYEKENLAFTDAQNYFEQLVKIITTSYALQNKIITHKINAHGIELNLDTLIPVALMFNELLTNSYKYAFSEKNSGEIYFELKKNSDGFVMTFKDDGSGLKEGFDFKKSTGLGSLMIQQLTQQLFGKFNIKSSLYGTEFNFTFKGL